MNIADNLKLAAALKAVQASPLLTFRATFVAPSVVVSGYLISRDQFVGFVERSIQNIDPYTLAWKGNIPPHTNRDELERIIGIYRQDRQEAFRALVDRYDAGQVPEDEIYMRQVIVSCSGYTFEHPWMPFSLSAFATAFVGDLETLSEVPHS